MRDEKEERKKQGQTNKQGKATQHTQGRYAESIVIHACATVLSDV